MEQDNKLKWKASTNRPEWISIYPSEGVGSQPVEIKVYSASSFTERDLEGTVTFECVDCGLTEKKVVKVTRCKPETCGEGTTTYVYQQSIIYPTTISKCGGKINVSIPYTSTTKYDIEGCVDSVKVSEIKKEYTISPNFEDEEKEIIFNYPSDDSDSKCVITVTQEKGPCKTCICTTGIIEPADYIDYRGTNGDVKITVCYFTELYCPISNVSIEVLNGVSWLHDLEYISKGIAGFIDKNDGEERVAKIKVTYNFGESEGCEETVSISQKANPETPTPEPTPSVCPVALNTPYILDSGPALHDKVICIYYRKNKNVYYDENSFEIVSCPSFITNARIEKSETNNGWYYFVGDVNEFHGTYRGIDIEISYMTNEGKCNIKAHTWQRDKTKV